MAEGAQLPNDPFGLVGTLLDGKHRVDRVIAVGGFGVVYAGHHLRLDVPIAIKVLKPLSGGPEQQAEAVTRFMEEARTTARLRHPHIAQVLDTGIAESASSPAGIAWMVLEWLDGETLAADLDRRRGQSARTPAECWRLIRPMLEAVVYAHEAGVVHRDLKPSNVMLARAGSGVIVKVLDFGIAKVVEAPEGPVTGVTTTQSAFSAFSPGYAAPEQIARTRTGPWTDVHALGLILTEMLTARAPYPAKSGTELYAMAFDPERPTPKHFGVDAGEWEPVIERALAIKPSDRYPSAKELFDALSAALSGAESRRVSLSAADLGLAATALATDETAPDPSRTWQDAPPSSATVPASTVSMPPPKRKLPAWAVGTLALAVVGSAIGIAVAAHDEAETAKTDNPTPSAVPLSPASAHPVETKTVELAIEPAGASVHVGGAKQVLHDGRLRLSGRPGSVHRVTLVHGERRLEEDVWITEHGAKPERLVLAPEDPPTRAPAREPVKAPPAKAAASASDKQPAGRVDATSRFD